jgi:hypothetical protein
MSVSYATTRVGNTTVVTVSSTLSGDVYFYWFVDGMFVGVSDANSRGFTLDDGDRSRIEVVDSNDAELDPAAIAPAGYPARKTLFWVRSLGNVDHYRIDQQKNGGDWSEVGNVTADDRWSYSFLSARLDDLASYSWRIVPVDPTGNDGNALTIDPETIVRTPDAPAFACAFSQATHRITITGAAA